MYPERKFWLLERCMHPRRDGEPSPEAALFRRFAESFPENRSSRWVCDVPTARFLDKLLNGEASLVEGPSSDGGYRFLRMPADVKYQVVYYFLGLTWFDMWVSVERILPSGEGEVANVSFCF